MGIDSVYPREHSREERLLGLLEGCREAEVLTRRPKWGDESGVIMRRGADIGREFFCYPCLDRGMRQARELIETGEKKGSAFIAGGVVIARKMEKSRGRFDRLWYAPSGGAWLTLVLNPAFLPENRQLYSLILGVACCETIRHYGVEANIKWVNDVHFHGQKLAGMLIEGYTSRTLGEEYLLLGIGVNVNNTSFPEYLRPMAISLRDILGKELSLEDFIALLLTKIGWHIGLMAHFEQRYLEAFYEPVKPANPLIEQWKLYSDTPGRRVLYGTNVYDEPLFAATAVDIDHTGAIILQREEGITAREVSGEIIYLN